MIKKPKHKWERVGNAFDGYHHIVTRLYVENRKLERVTYRDAENKTWDSYHYAGYPCLNLQDALKYARRCQSNGVAFEEALKEEIRLELYREFGPDGVGCTPNVTMTTPDRNRVQLVSNLLSLLDTLDRAAAIKLRHSFAKPIEEGTVAAELVIVEAINASAKDGARFEKYPGTNNYGWWTVPHQLKRKG